MRYFIKRYYFIVFVCLLFSCSNKSAQDYIDEGIRYTAGQEYDKAIESFKKAVAADPKNPLAHYTLGGIYTFKDLNEKAIVEYKKAIELDAAYPDPHYSLGYVYEKLGMEEEAKHEYRIFEMLKDK